MTHDEDAYQSERIRDFDSNELIINFFFLSYLILFKYIKLSAIFFYSKYCLALYHSNISSHKLLLKLLKLPLSEKTT